MFMNILCLCRCAGMLGCVPVSLAKFVSDGKDNTPFALSLLSLLKSKEQYSILGQKRLLSCTFVEQLVVNTLHLGKYRVTSTAHVD